MTRPPTKADLQAAVERLTRENAALRELLAAVHETAAAGDAINMGDNVWGAGGRAAQRIAIWLGDDILDRDIARWDISRVERQARLFRENVASIMSLGEPAKAAADSVIDAVPQCPAGLLRDGGDWADACKQDAGHEPPHESAHNGDWDDDHPRHLPDINAHEFPASGMQDPGPVVRVIGGVCMMAGCGHGEDEHTKSVRQPGAGVRLIGCRECDCNGYLSPEALAKATALVTGPGADSVLRGARIGGTS